MSVIKIKNGETIILREAVKEDAGSMIEYLGRIAGESDFLTFGPGELVPTLEQETAVIEGMRNVANKVMIVAVVGNRIIGSMSFAGGTRSRVQHTGELGISLAKDYWGMGIGTSMMSYLIEWAKASKVVRKLNLQVRSDNARAITLYKKLGFFEEGTNTRGFYINGKFFDFIQMGLHID